MHSSFLLGRALGELRRHDATVADQILDDVAARDSAGVQRGLEDAASRPYHRHERRDDIAALVVAVRAA
jgi:hypothetical protein